MVKLFISVYNRPDYLDQSLDSLNNSFSAILPEIIITDDGSTDPKVHPLLEKFSTAYKGPLKIIRNKERKGIPFGKLDTIYEIIYKQGYNEPYFFISDSDIIYKKAWLEELIYLHEQTKTPLVTGFNTETNKHTTLKKCAHYYVKESVGGCNLLVSTQFYTKYPFREPQNWDFIMCERAHQEHRFGVIAARPSLVDHIGIEGY
jgi:glycosyltransferase involved in cell wall biosynthesis